MSSLSDLLEDLAGSDDEDLSPERVADLWILLGARSGSYARGTVLRALADVDIAVRAMVHVVSPADERLTKASRRFLRDLVSQSSAREIEEWLTMTRVALAEAEPRADREALLSALRAAASEGRWIVEPAEASKTHLLVRFLAERLSPDDRLTAAAELASLHPDMEHAESGTIRALLATVAARDRLVEKLSGDPRYVLSAEDIADSVLRQARIASEAMASVWEYPMLEPGAAAVALGAKPSNRERVRTYRERSWLLGLPRGRGYVYPQFQFEPKTQDVYQEVRRANEILSAVSDPWGVASWWIVRNDRIEARPVDLVGTSRATEIQRAAETLLEPVG